MKRPPKATQDALGITPWAVIERLAHLEALLEKADVLADVAETFRGERFTVTLTSVLDDFKRLRS